LWLSTVAAFEEACLRSEGRQGAPKEFRLATWRERTTMSERLRNNTGALAAEIVSSTVYQRQIERLCLNPRLMAELLAETMAEQGIRAEIEAKLQRYCGLSFDALAITGALHFSSPLLTKVAA
jgi:hypothetical protein